MVKKLISSALALSLVFGTAAVLPEMTFTSDNMITASAAGALSGAVDDTINWAYDGKGKLTLSGTGFINEIGEDCKLFDKVKAEDITELVISEGIEGIGYRDLFEDLVNVSKITVADSITDMCANPFYNTKWYKNALKKNDLVILNGILIDGSNAKGDVVIPDSVKMICDDAFVADIDGLGADLDNNEDGKWISSRTYVYYNKNIKSVKLPESLKIIGNRAFAGCVGLKKISFPDSLERIGECAFAATKLLDSKEKIQYIDNWLIKVDNEKSSSNNMAIENANKVHDLKIKDGTVGIADYAAGLSNDYFSPGSRWTTVLEAVTIPGSVRYIGNYAFNRSQDLKSITIPKGVVKIGDGAFEYCTSLKKITIPSNVKIIGYWAFYNCSSLKTVKLNEGLETIEGAAFVYNDTLTSITVPASVKKIGGYALGLRTDKTGESTSTDGFTIICYSGTAAHKYAKANKISYKLIERTSVKNAKVTLSKTSYVYSGKAKKPGVTVKLGKTKLTKGIDFTVTYKKNKAVGKATVTVKGKGAYTGTVSKTFKINPKKTSVKKATSPKTGQLKVTYKKVKGVTGYQVTYSTSKKFTKKTTKTVTVKGKAKTSKVIKKLKSGKKYYVKVRSYKTVSGKKYYSSYTAVKTVKVK